MKKIGLILLLLSVCLTLLSCGNNDLVTSSGQHTNSTTPMDTTLVTTNPPEYNANSEQAHTYTGHITSSESIPLNRIKIDVYEMHNPKIMSRPSALDVPALEYDPSIDYSDYKYSYEYVCTVFTDENGNYSFESSYDQTVCAFFDLETLPVGYGIRKAEGEYFSPSDATEGYHVMYNSQNPSFEFVVEKVEAARLECIQEKQSFWFYAELYSATGTSLFGYATVSKGRFEDNFVDAMINGSESKYTATITCGDFSTQASETVWWEACRPWEWRVGYLYYNNYIDKAQYDEIFSTREPTKSGPYY